MEVESTTGGGGLGDSLFLGLVLNWGRTLF